MFLIKNKSFVEITKLQSDSSYFLHSTRKSDVDPEGGIRFCYPVSPGNGSNWRAKRDGFELAGNGG